ncbi:MAG: tetratricopeptide repeat protein [Pseudomonadota bacterium]
MFPAIGLSYLLAILLCVHAMRTGREMYWLFILLAFPGLGSLVYLLVNVLPELLGGATVRRLGRAARETLDPEREYRAARAACDDSPTVGARMRLASAASALGRFEEAERLYGEAAAGIHADDPALLLGRARALIELSRPAEALALLERLGEQGEAGRTPQAALAMGRAYHALGRHGEADTAYQWAAGRLPGLEGLARYAAFLAETGRRDEAAEALAEIDKRAARTTAHFRKEARAWRDFAAQALG